VLAGWSLDWKVILIYLKLWSVKQVFPLFRYDKFWTFYERGLQMDVILFCGWHQCIVLIFCMLSLFSCFCVKLMQKTEKKRSCDDNCKCYTIVHQVSPDGKQFPITSPDRRIRVFWFRTGKLRLVYDEFLEVIPVMSILSFIIYLLVESSVMINYHALC
jgi:hypothetical protein